MQEFRDAKGYEGHYQISKCGQVKSLNRTVISPKGRKYAIKERILKYACDNQGYAYVVLSLPDGSEKVQKIHRLVGFAWLPEPPAEKKYINHKDGDKLNNHADNLEWVTASENQIHKFRVLKYKQWCTGKLGSLHPTSKTVIQLSLENEFVAEYGSTHEAARKTGFNRGAIASCCRGTANKHKNFKWKYK